MRRPALSFTTSHLALLPVLLPLSLFVVALLLPVIFAVGHVMSSIGDHQTSRITPKAKTVVITKYGAAHGSFPALLLQSADTAIGIGGSFRFRGMGV